MYRAIIFDMDDTLIQTKRVKYAAHIHAAKKFYNLDLTDADLDIHWGKPFPAMVRGIYGEVEPLDSILAKYYSIGDMYPIPAYPGALQLVSRLAGHCSLGLLTAANHRLMISAMTDAGIPLAHFRYVQTSDDTNYHKPDPLVFLGIAGHTTLPRLFAQAHADYVLDFPALTRLMLK